MEWLGGADKTAVSAEERAEHPHPKSVITLTVITTPGVGRSPWGWAGWGWGGRPVDPEAGETKRPGRVRSPRKRLEGEAAELAGKEPSSLECESIQSWKLSAEKHVGNEEPKLTEPIAVFQ